MEYVHRAVPTNSSGIAVARRVAEALRDEAADAGARPRVRRAAHSPQVPPIRRLDDGVVQKLRMLDGAGAVARVNEPDVTDDLPDDVVADHELAARHHQDCCPECMATHRIAPVWLGQPRLLSGILFSKSRLPLGRPRVAALQGGPAVQIGGASGRNVRVFYDSSSEL